MAGDKTIHNYCCLINSLSLRDAYRDAGGRAPKVGASRRRMEQLPRGLGRGDKHDTCLILYPLILTFS
jgi:hypothetical protein